MPDQTPVNPPTTKQRKQKKNLFSYRPLFSEIHEIQEINNNDEVKDKVGINC